MLCLNDWLELLLSLLMCAEEEQPPKHCLQLSLKLRDKRLFFFLLLCIDTLDKSPECQCGSCVCRISKDNTSSGISCLWRALAPILNPLQHVGDSVTNSATGGGEIFEPAAKREKRGLFWRTALFFNRVLSHLCVRTQLTLPWGTFSSLDEMNPAQSDDGPIMWVRPGEQMIPVADIPKSPFKRKR